MLIRLATRKSALALWQAEHVAERLQALDEVDSVELVPLSTRGDEILDRSLQKIGGKGLFIKELEVAMQQGNADIAVHSMKDVPAVMPDGFRIAALLERANHSDAFVAAWLPGTEGEDIADVLFGDHAPAGKLSFSWPRSADQHPLNVGDPDYDPLFAFGYGLSW